MWYKNVGKTFFCFVTIHAFDRRTYKRTDRRLSRAYTVCCIKYSRTVKTVGDYTGAAESHTPMSATSSQSEKVRMLENFLKFDGL